MESEPCTFPQHTSDGTSENKKSGGLFSALKINVGLPLVTATSWLFKTLILGSIRFSTITLTTLVESRKQYTSVSSVFGVTVSAFGYALYNVSGDRSFGNLYTCVFDPLFYVVHKLSLCLLKHHPFFKVLSPPALGNLVV